MKRAHATVAAFGVCIGFGSGCKRGESVAADAVLPDANLPPVEPRGPNCDELDVESGKRCLQEGWFLFSRWTTAELYGAHTEDVPAIPLRPVYLDTFLIDEREVTNLEYAGFLARTESPAPPDRCGYVDYLFDVEGATITDPEISGWVNGVADATRGNHPVVCVTRDEARSFCEERGGRLPTVFEWTRTVRDAFPDARRFPWGDTPPPMSAEPWPSLGTGRWWDPYAVVSRVGPDLGPGLWTEPVGSASSGASAAGVLDLAGNASELLSSCGEDLAQITESTEPAVRPEEGGRQARCADGVVVAGSNWRSYLDAEETLASVIWIMRDGANAFRYPDSSQLHYASLDMRRNFWGDAEPAGAVPTTAGNDRRSWRIGFRCAYDVASQQ